MSTDDFRKWVIRGSMLLEDVARDSGVLVEDLLRPIPTADHEA